MYERLFSPANIGRVQLKNRLVMTAMGVGLAELDGTPSEDMLAYYEARAAGGAGLIIPEITRIDDVTGVGLMRQLAVTKDRQIAPLSRLAAAVHKHGAKIFIQLHHPGRETLSVLIGGQPVVAPSAVMCKFTRQKTRALTHEEIRQLVQRFIDGAVRVQKAGCDGVELHAAHGYLLNQFLSPYTNKRTDEYGGSFENRLRFLAEIIAGIRAACGDGFPVTVRLTVDEFLDQTGVTEDYIHLQDGVRIAAALEALGIDAINVSCGIYETGITCVEPMSFPQGWRRNLIQAVKDRVHIPVIGASVIREPAVAEKFLEDGVEDFVGLGRAWLADEQWGRKVQEGREKELRKCISCMRCFESLEQYGAAGQPLECAVNPRAARERRYGDAACDVAGHRAVVIGGGPAGMCAAETLAKRGVHITLFEKAPTLGGMLNLGKEPPHKEKMQWVSDYYAQTLPAAGVDVRLATEATAETVAAEQPDAVVLASGSLPLVPGRIPGVHGKNVYTVWDVLGGGARLSKKKVAVIGAGMTGIETAEYLCGAGNAVTVIDMLGKVAPEGNQTVVLDVMNRLKKHNTAFLLGHALREITETGVRVENQSTGAVQTVEADAVVLSLGVRSDTRLLQALRDKGLKVHVIGDAARPGRIAPATRNGFELGRSLFTKPAAAPSFRLSPADLQAFGRVSLMRNQTGIYLAFLSDPAVIARLLPPPLKPFSLPVVTLSVAHIQNPSFADDYYEAILGIYATHGKTLGLYPLSLLLGGPGQEMATQLGRDNGAIPKKLGAEISIHRDGDTVTARVARKGVQLVDARLELGAYNSPLTDALYQSPAPDKRVYGGGFYFKFDRMPDENGVSHFISGALLQNLCEYTYHTWEPGTASLTLRSGKDDPWAELPVVTIAGGAFSNNDLTVHKLNRVESLDAEAIAPYLLTGYYDRTAFMETGRI